MKKRILLIGYNFHPEPTGIGKYSGEMIQWFAEKGYDCTVFTAYPYYPYWKVQEPYYKNRFWFKTEKQEFPSGGKIKIIRCPMYVPSNPTGRKRMLLDLSFSFSASLQLIKHLFYKKKFDVIITPTPSFQFGLLGIFYKKLRGAKLIYHVHDMQIEAARDLGMIKSPTVIKQLFKIERYIFRQADIVSAVSEGMIPGIQKKAKKDILFFPNWTNISSFYPIENRFLLKREFGFEPEDKTILYSGAIGEKQGLEAILHAANYFKNNTNVKFIICGSGPYKEKLIKISADLKLSNVYFYPLQPIENFNKFLNMADVHLIIQKADASDLMMPSKLTTILAAGGLSLITANNGSGLHSLITKHQVGISVKPENQTALNLGIEEAINKNNDHYRKKSRSYAEKYLAIDTILQSFEINLK